MEDNKIKELIKELDIKINKAELEKDQLIKNNNRIEVEKGVIENTLEKLQKELNEEFGLEDLDEETLKILIEKIEKELKEVMDEVE